MRAMSEEDHQKFLEFKKNGNADFEEDKTKICCPWTDKFAYAIQLFRIMSDDLDFSKPFRIVVDYDPDQPRTVIHHYVRKCER